MLSNIVKKYRKPILIVLSVVFIISAVLLVGQIIDQKAAADSVDKAKDIANIPSFEDFNLGGDYDDWDDEDDLTEAADDTDVNTDSDTVGDDESTENTQTSEATTAPATTEVITTEAETKPQPQKSIEETLLGIDLAALQKVNKDVIGWIAVPGTPISYPLMRSKDNKDYLRKTWEGKYSYSGSIFLEKLCTPDMSDFHTIIYGHNMHNTSFFSPLVKYKNKSYRNARPYVYIVTEERLYKYEIYSSYEALVKSITYSYEFSSDGSKEKFIEHTVSSSVWKATARPTVDDSILTLSTCTMSGAKEVRWVVHSILSETWER